MTVNALTSASAANSTPTNTPSNSLTASTSSFLQLFMAQLQQQDPLDPQNSSDMVGELAQLSTVEQGAQTNQTLQSLVSAHTSSSNANLANLVGRTCDATVGSFQITATGGAPPAVAVSASSTMSGASLVVTDAAGNQVASVPIPTGTSATVQWNGLGSNGAALPPGSYTMTVKPGTGNTAITAQWQGAVSAVQLGSSGTELQIGDVLLDPSTISAIGATTSSSSSTTNNKGATP
jgi:flagellar basal-body rod modification protein FlgD